MRFVVLRQTEAGASAGALTPLAPLTPTHGVTVHTMAELAPPDQAVRVVFDDAGATEAAGSFAAGGRALAGLAVVEAPSRDAAVAWLSAQPDGQSFELRETGCASGLAGVDPTRPATRPRFLVALRADADTEAETAPPPERLARMGAHNDAAVQDGLLLAADGLRSSARATRVSVAAGRARVLDGPFAEAKELVAGFWLVQAPTLADVVAWVRGYPYAQTRPVVEVRPVVG